jgi:hypothetical protein
MVTATARGGRFAELDTGRHSSSFSIALDAPSGGTVAVPWRITSGTAVEDEDYDDYYALRGTATFAPGETLKTITFLHFGDLVPEPDESLILEIFSAPGVDLPGGAARHQAVGWLIDDDGFAQPSALWVSDPTIVERDSGRTSVTYELSLSRPADRDLEIPYRILGDSATAGKDFDARSGTALIPRDTTETLIRFDLLGDRVAEGLEHADLVLDLPPGVAESHGGRLTIVDNDTSPFPTVLLSPAIFPEGATGRAASEFTIALSAPAAAAVSVPWRIESGTAVEDVDYDDYYALSGTATFAPGETLKTISFLRFGDADIEFDESVVFRVATPAGPAILPGKASQIETVGWIRDDDGRANPLALFVSSPDLREGDKGSAAAVFEFELSRPAPRDLDIRYATLDGSAVAGEDYAAKSGTLRILEGQSAGTVSVKVRGDTKFEDAESFSLRLFLDGGIGQSFGGRATIENDDSRSDFWVQRGGAGNDRLRGYEHRDKIHGRDGDDRIWGYDGNDRLDGGKGHDTLRGGAGSDRLHGGSGNDALSGGRGHDRLSGGSGNDRLTGGSGNDRLSGGSGKDRLDGGSGRDVLTGGKGNDVLTGGKGKDVFVFAKKDGRDRITDFEDDRDIIQITNGAKRFKDLSLKRDDGDTIVKFGGTTITIEDERPGAIGAEDFIFG